MTIFYSFLVDACSKCGESCSAVELIALICARGYQPDAALISAVAFAVGRDKSDNHVDPDDLWTTKDWRALSINRQKVKTNAVPVTVPHGAGIYNKALFTGDDLSSLPKLRWTGFPEIARSSVFAASPRLQRHMILAENLLGSMFPGLEIDLSHPFGTSCPNPKCCKPQSISQVISGFTRGDPNVYTTRCYSCDRHFVPRFAVQCSLESWEGSEKKGPGSILWCEFLSPWVLRKEVLSVLFNEGVDVLIARQQNPSSLRDNTTANQSISSHNPVVFWNLIVSFRLRGLPYTFLLTQSLEEAFPTKKKQSPEGPASQAGKSFSGSSNLDGGSLNGSSGILGRLFS